MKVLKPGIRYRIYLGGYTVTRPPSGVAQGEPQVAEDSRRYRDGELAITRLRPYTGAPDSLTKRSWSIFSSSSEIAVSKSRKVVFIPGCPSQKCAPL